MSLLDQINSPSDIKRMSVDELTTLCAEMRSALLKKLSARGGHIGPNLGMVEAIVAMHYVFDAPHDKIVYDVSHQSYPHKMLTGRMRAFTEPEHYSDVTGYTNPDESPYDLFSVGHTSTSVALAAGLAKARDMEGGTENVIAVIGDASLGGGEAFEGLNYGSTLGTNFIVIVNDNQMSIAENHGGLYADLRLLRNSNGTAEPNFFRSVGYGYRYVRYGNDLRSLIEAFRAVKDIDHPVVVHINTMKGLGLPAAESNKEAFHYAGPFDLKTGAPAVADNTEDYTDIFAKHILGRMKDDEKLVVVNAGTPGAIGFTPERRREAGRRFVDVGIAEQMAVGMSAGLAKGGARPMVGLVATFLQRAYDQLSQDVAINKQPAAFTTFYTGMFGMTDETHLGIFDIALLSNIPNLIYLAPTCREEYVAMMDWALTQDSCPVAVRTPGGPVVSSPGREILTDYSKPQYEVVSKGGDVAIIGVGCMFTRALEAASLMEQHGKTPTVINPRNVTQLDTDTLDRLRDYRLVITIEDGILDGGFGQKVAQYLGDASVEVKCLGLDKHFYNRYNPAKLARQYGLDPDQIAELAR